MNKTNDKILPQGGTSCLAAGESATSPLEASCPTYSGGGISCLNPLASGNKSRGGSRSEGAVTGSDVDQVGVPDKVSGVCGEDAPVNKFWRGSSLGGRQDAGSDSDSVSGVGSAGSGRESFEITADNAERFRKRPRAEDGKGSSSSGERLASARKVPKKGGGRGRGEGSASKEAARRAAERAEEGRHLGRRVLSSSSSGGEPETGGKPGEPEIGVEPNTGDGSDCERLAGFAEIVRNAIRDVGLKRTYASKTKAISAASTSILAAAKALCGRPPSDEMSVLRAEVTRSAAAMQDLREENGRLRSELAGLRKADPKEVLQKGRERGQSQPQAAEDRDPNLVRQELADLRRRLSFMEGIVLRPSLGAKTFADATAGDPKAGPSGRPNSGAAKSAGKPAPAKPAPGPANKTAAPQKGKAEPPPPKGKMPAQKKGKAPAQKKGKAAVAKGMAAAAKEPVPEADPPPTPPSPPKPPEAEEGWLVAGDKRKGRKAAQKARRAERKRRQKKRSVAAKLRAPKTAAVVVTLQPDAEKRGMTYRQLITQAKAMVHLEDLGITGGLRLRVTATGARMLEIPADSSASAADALAEKLRASLNADEVRVSRPVKCASLRIMGLDDSVFEEEVVAAVTAAGGCSAEQVKAGTLRPDRGGMLTVTVSCPVTAAKKIAEGHTLKVGWSRAQVKLLEPRPLRCFRCHVGHHVGCRCTSEVDRSELCFRCGQPGHKAAACLATPHCNACAAAGKPAEHRAGSKACAPPAKAKGKERSSATTNPTVANAAAAAAAANAATAATPAAVAPQEAPEGAEMDCH